MPTLNNLRLVDLLDAIVRGADRPIKYSVLEYAVRFFPAGLRSCAFGGSHL